MTGRKKRRAKQKQARERQRQRSRKSAPYPANVDRRGINVEATAMDGVPLDEPQTLVIIEPIRLKSGDVFYFESPFVIPFYLMKSKQLRDRGEPKRRKALKERKEESDGTFSPIDSSLTFDALEDLALASILALAAIEAHANDAIGRLPDDAMAEVPRRVGDRWMYVMRDKNAMGWFKLGEKLTRAVPVLTGLPSIKGTAAWQKYRKLARVRNGLLHPERKALNNPDKPGPFGRLMLGHGSDAPEDAVFVIDALEPGWLPTEIMTDIGTTPKHGTTAPA